MKTTSTTLNRIGYLLLFTFIIIVFGEKLNSQIIYKKLVPSVKISTYDFFTFNFFEDTVNTGDPANIDVWNHTTEIVISLDVNSEILCDDFDSPLALDKGTVIAENSTIWKTSTYLPLNQDGFLGNWIDVKGKYIAIRSKKDNQWYYGWAKMDVDLAPTYFVIYDYAYNSVPGASIKAGDDGVVVKTPVIALNSTALDFKSITVGSTGSQTLVIKNTGNSPLTISNLTITTDVSAVFSFKNKPGVTVLQAGDSISVIVQFIPKAAKSYTARIIVTSDASNGTAQIVQLSGVGTAVAEPIFVVDILSLSFGPLKIQETEDSTILLKNDGGTSLQISSMKITNDPSGVFSITNSTGIETILAKSSMSLIVRFSPKAIGNYSAVLTISSNDPNSPTKTINLTGIAYSDINGVEDETVAEDVINVYPNPVTPSSRIEIDKKTASYINMVIYSMTGAKVGQIINNELLDMGTHTYSMPVLQLSSGNYILEYISDGKLLSKKIVIE